MPEISQRSDDFFTLRSYVLDDGGDAIRGWFERQSAEVQADMVVAFDTLRKTPRKYWRRIRFAELGKKGGVCAGLVEIRVFGLDADDEREHYRILAFFGPAERQLTMLMPFKKGDDPDYSKSCPEAQDRKAKVQDEPNRSRECEI